MLKVVELVLELEAVRSRGAGQTRARLQPPSSSAIHQSHLTLPASAVPLLIQTPSWSSDPSQVTEEEENKEDVWKARQFGHGD